jgi:uncharacterized protein (DUF736 family)
MMKLGSFLQDSSGDMHGRIHGLGLGVTSVIFEPQTSKEGMPYFRVIANPVGEAYDIGAAFEKEKDGLKYYSVCLDSPALAGPVNAVLFPDRGNSGAYNLFWERPDMQKPKLELIADGRQSGRKFVGAAAAPSA